MFFKSNFIKTNGTTKRGRKIYVETPRGRIVEVRHKDGKVSMKLQWADSFSKKQNQNFRNAQAFIDSECIRLMVKYTPARNNILYKSATLGTQIGSGEIHQVAPYARYRLTGEACRTKVLEVLVDKATGPYDAWQEYAVIKPQSYGGAQGGVSIPYNVSFDGGRQ